jgi:hypothetical protein
VVGAFGQYVICHGSGYAPCAARDKQELLTHAEWRRLWQTSHEMGMHGKSIPLFAKSSEAYNNPNAGNCRLMIYDVDAGIIQCRQFQVADIQLALRQIAPYSAAAWIVHWRENPIPQSALEAHHWLYKSTNQCP